MSDALTLPLTHLVIEVANNEDWIDTIVYVLDAPEPPPEPPETPGPTRRRNADLEQMDLRGIDFTMHIRRQPQVNEVVLEASTADGGLQIAPPPNTGYLIFAVREPVMRTLWPGRYVGDVIARDDRNFQRVCLTLDFTVIEGITR
jgi:hypothetical protein